MHQTVFEQREVRPQSPVGDPCAEKKSAEAQTMKQHNQHQNMSNY